jgi:acyl-[acyl-carrier-protein] desaturase
VERTWQRSYGARAWIRGVSDGSATTLLPRAARAAPRVDVAAHEEIIRALAPAVERNLLLLRPAATAWQPADYLPDLTGEGWQDALAAFRACSRHVPDPLLVVLVGDMVTEEALPSYSMALNGLVQDREGIGAAAWARWLRGWTAEENRHGDLLNAYLRLSGRVDMRAVERTVQSLIAAGFSAGSGDDPYNLLVYTSFQERATRISHGNVARLAESAGDGSLGRICRVIAGDEARHEAFYTRMMAEVLDADASGGILALATMLDRQIAMPGRLMADGHDPSLFDHFAAVAQRLGVYTAHDYAAIIEHLVTAWRIAERRVDGEAARAQEVVCRSAARYRRLADRFAAAVKRQPAISFSWIHGRLV